MRCMKVLLLLLLFASVTFGQSIEDRIKKFEDSKRYSSTYDKFAKASEVLYQNGIVKPVKGTAKQIWITATITDSKEISVMIDAEPSQPSYLQPLNTRLRFLLDGQLMDVPGEGSVFYLDGNQWAKISSASKIEMQYLGFEGVWGDKLMVAIKNFNSLTQ